MAFFTIEYRKWGDPEPITDLAGAFTLGAPHVAEAIQYRRLDRHGS